MARRLPLFDCRMSLKNTITLLILGLAAFPAMGSPSKQEIERKTDQELISLLNDNDSSVRCIAVMVLGLRFDNPHAPVILSPISPQTPHPEGTAMPNELVEKTSVLAKGDGDLKVRLSALKALSSFKCRTNTTPILTILLEDHSCIIRIRAAQALISFKHEYHEPISDKTVQVLIDCLNPNNSSDDIWQAAETLGNLGVRAKQSLPYLKELEHHNSKQVREYAEEAVRKIQKKSNRKTP
jgi:HEAT repeat protein